MQFHEKRRQQFLTEAAYIGTKEYFRGYGPRLLAALSDTDADASDRGRLADAYFQWVYSDYLLGYTAGEPIDRLRTDLEKVINALEQATIFNREREKDPDFPPLYFSEIGDYEQVVQMIGLCFLLHRQDLLPRLAAMFDPTEKGQDTLYEEMLAFGMEGRLDVDTWYHEGYRDLINTMFSDTDEEIYADFDAYLKKWYSSLSKAVWHDSHLKLDGDNTGGYFGYWAIEAAALAYLMELDDTNFRQHIVYPGDLVDFARSLDASALGAGSSPQELRRVEGGAPCPETGYWSTPAQGNSRRFFHAGETMPIYIQSSYGKTIWQWSDVQ